jgi:ectoine hydroxylase-related dioxygenase (phytanoyl-CoA dioxygenase family)
VSGLTERQVDEFFDRGFVFPVDALDQAAAGELCAELRRYEAIVDHGDSPFLKMHKHFPKIHLLTTWADRLAHVEPILDAVESIVGPDVLAWSSGIFTRPAGSSEKLAWHQDIAYFGLENFRRAVRVWIALTHTSAANGTMRFAPRSHLSGVVEHSYAAGDAESLAQGEEIRVSVDESTAVDVVLTAGQCSLHHLALAHCSGPNATERDRVNFTVDYIAPEVEPLSRPDSALLVRGSDTYGFYEPESRPRVDFGEAELAAYFRAVRMRDRRILLAMKEAASSGNPTQTA